jgi:hypothetical protein
MGFNLVTILHESARRWRRRLVACRNSTPHTG